MNNMSRGLMHRLLAYFTLFLLLFFFCFSISRDKSDTAQKNVSLKNLYDQLLESKLASFSEIEASVGKLTVYSREKEYSSFSANSFKTNDGHVVRANDVRIKTQNTNDIVKMILDIESEKC